MNKTPRVFHPILFAIFPVFFLYSRNIGEVLFISFFLPTVIIIIASAILLALSVFLCKDKYKAGFIVSFFWAYFFMYANVFCLFRGVTVAGMDLHKHALILLVWTVLFTVCIIVVLKWKYDLAKVTKIANVVALCLIITSSVTITSRHMKNAILEKSATLSNGQMRIGVPSKLPSDLPDIYYIILDQHVSNDVLETYFNYDNSEFADNLRKRGFYFAEKSRSNYCQTRLSLASSMNFQYLDFLTEQYGSDSSNSKPMVNMVKRSRLTRFLKDCGYTIAAFSTNYEHTELRNSDVFFSIGWSPDEYQRELLINTVLLPFFNNKLTRQGHRRQILNPIENISKVSELDSPVFTFVHIICPHTPYVFDENGNAISGNGTFVWTAPPEISEEVVHKKYLGQVKFIDRKITEAIDVILEKSEKPPLIILQSDHGTRWKFGSSGSETDYRPFFGILNAYYLPGFDHAKLYDSITPVNSFRLILNHYFGTDLDVLEDKTYYSAYKKPYDFTDLTEKSDRNANE